MIKNYLKVAWRNLSRNKVYSFINISGLAVGMAVTILIGLWIYDEISFNRYHKNYDHIAQVIQNVTNNGEVGTWRTVPYPLAEELRKNYGSDFKHIVMGAGGGNHILSVGEKKLTKNGIYFEPEGPEMLTLNMLRGDWNGLKDPSSVLLSASAAKAFFGDEDPVNKMMKIDNEQDVKVTGVYDDIPQNSTFSEFAFIAPWQLYFSHAEWVKNAPDPWRPNAFMIAVQLADNADMDAVSLKIKDAKLRNVNKELAKKKPALFLDPMSRWHLYDEFKNGVNVGGRIQYVWMFGIIGVFVLLLACINFMNLSTARSERRAKEVGIRKAVGSLRRQLISQFFSESILVVTFAFVLSLLLVQICLPFFNEVSDKKMHILWGNPWFWAMSIVFSLITGLIAGSYPALYLSSFQPIKVLKGVFKAGRFAALPRKVLVVLQFTVCVSLIIGTLVVFRQIEYTKDRPVGYERNALLSLPMGTNEIHNHFDAVKKELTDAGVIVSMAESGGPVTGGYSTSSGFSWKGKDPNFSTDIPNMEVSYDYGKTINWSIKEGRDFSREFATDSSAVVLNEAAVRFMDLKNPIGETITWFGQPLTVIGVTKDMIMQSPYDPIRPTVFYLTNEASGFIIAKLKAETSAREALAKIETVFKKFNPEQPFEYNFVDEEYAKKFGNEERIGKLAGFFAALAILISCLGLFGMASFIAEQRRKEIGVRKVLGASVFNLWRLLSKDFITLIVISLFIAGPLAYYFMHGWLQNYEYRAALSWWIFATAGIGGLMITIITVSFQAIKAAVANPVKSLRTE
jgi:ABC-type antimicrobial peptide transport system permease subunit